MSRTPMVATSEAVLAGGVIAQGLGYVNAWKGKTVVVKFGGSVLDVGAGAAGGSTIADDLVLLKGAGINAVLVHGGGPEITRMLERLGKPSKFVHGLRVTDAETMEVVEMVLAGRANKSLVSAITQAGGRAVGLSGKDGRMLLARKYESDVDLGQVGEVEAVDPALVRSVSADGYIPVIASIGIGQDGTSYNLNADTAAGALAVAVGASKFILLTDVDGVYRNHEARTLISELRAAEAEAMTRDGTISRGMIPKVGACLDAIRGGVPSAHIINGTVPHALLVELFTERGIGTMLTS
ncbi:MAG TPA: acetylglutamate kinase [bacterium]|nr:acetylglutamate kinase [bacterium]